MSNKYTPPANKPIAIICDIDGTLAHGIGVTRKPYEWNKVDTDTVDESVRDILVTYGSMERLDIILLSGRDGSCRNMTMEWLDNNGVPYDELYMREAGDKRQDTVIKKELFDKHIRDNYRVLFVLDDRPSVCRMWRSIRLKVLQVGDPDIEF